MVSGIGVGPLVGKSDHSPIIFNFHCVTGKVSTTEYTVYDKGHYDQLRSELSVDWEVILANCTAKETWKAIRSRIEAKRGEAVLTRILKPQQNKPIWMDGKTMDKVKKKRQAWRKFKRYRDANSYAEYATCS